MTKNIMIIDGRWFTNVGESFINLGATELAKRIWPESNVITCGDMTEYFMLHERGVKASFWHKLLRNYREREKRLDQDGMIFHFSDAYKPDIIIQCGMLVGDFYLEDYHVDHIHDLVKNGARIAYLGVGKADYSDKATVDKWVEFVNELNPLIVTTRDTTTFNELNGKLDCPLVNAIDTAFWLKDAVTIPEFSTTGYDLVTYNRSAEPDYIKEEVWPRKIIRPWHLQFDWEGRHAKKCTFISDSILDYMTLYRNAHEVHTDLVHATIISLQYGVPVKNQPTDGRIKVLENLEGLSKDENGFLHLDIEKLESQKKRVIAGIREKLGE